MKILKGDNVQIITGKDKGKKGKVTAVFVKKNKVIVEGINMVKRHQKGRQGAQSAIISKESPLWVSKVKLIDPESGKPTRVGYEIDKGGNKYRVAKVTGKMLKVETKKK